MLSSNHLQVCHQGHVCFNTSIPDIVVGVVVLDEIKDQMQHQLPAYGFVSVHVCHVLHIRLADHVLIW